MTHDKEHLLVSDGSDKIAFWDPAHPGHAVRTLTVTGHLDGRKVRLSCC